MEYLRRLGLIGTITIVLAITKMPFAVRQIPRPAASLRQWIGMEKHRILPRVIAVAATTGHLIAAERIPRNRVQNPIMAVVGQAWRTIAGFAPFVSIRRNPRSQRLPLRLLAWRTVLGRSTSGPIHRSDLSSLPCMLADHPQPSSAPRVEGLTGLILSSRTGKMSAPPRASCPS